MANIRQGRCNNFGNCSKADTGVVIDIINNSVQPPTCPECGLPLVILTNENNSMKKWLLGVVGIVLSVIGWKITHFPTTSIESTKNDITQMIDVKSKSATPVEQSKLTTPPDEESKQTTPKSDLQTELSFDRFQLKNIEIKEKLYSAYHAFEAADTLKLQGKKGSTLWKQKINNALLEYNDITQQAGESACTDFKKDSDDKDIKAISKDRLNLLAKTYAGLATILSESGEKNTHKIEQILLNGKHCLDNNDVADVNAKMAIYTHLFELRLEQKNTDEILYALNDLVKDSAVIDNFGTHKVSFCNYLRKQLAENNIPRKSDLYREIKREITEHHRISCTL